MGNSAKAIFDADDSRFHAAIQRMDRALLGLRARFVTALAFGSKVTAPITLAAAALTAGITEAIEKGREFEIKARQTGAAAGDIFQLEKGFKKAGVEAEAAVPSLQKMLFSIQKGTADKIIEKMGVNLEALKKKTPVQQFNELGKAINALPSAAQKIEAARDIFGKSGAELLAVFASPGFGSNTISDQAEILNRDAGLFSYAAGRLRGAGVDIQGFFLGVADKVVPVLLPLLDRLEKLDLSRKGQLFGETIATSVTTALNQGFWETIGRNATIVFGEAVNAMTGSITGRVAAAVQIMIESAQEFGRLLLLPLDGEAWKGLGSSLEAIAHRFVSILLAGIARMIDDASKLPGLGGLKFVAASTRQAATGEAARADAAQDRGASARASVFGKLQTDVRGALANVAKEFEQGTKGGRFFDNAARLAILNDASADVAAGNRAMIEKGLLAHPSSPGLTSALDSAQATANVSSLTRIGGNFGGNAGDPLLSSAIRRESLLREIARNTSIKVKARAVDGNEPFDRTIAYA